MTDEGFEWDEAKRAWTLRDRALDFEDAARVFEGVHREREDARRAYGEPRYAATGEVDGVVITVVWTPRGGRRRIISAWPASNRERREYGAHRALHERADPAP